MGVASAGSRNNLLLAATGLFVWAATAFQHPFLSNPLDVSAGLGPAAFSLAAVLVLCLIRHVRLRGAEGWEAPTTIGT